VAVKNNKDTPTRSSKSGGDEFFLVVGVEAIVLVFRIGVATGLLVGVSDESSEKVRFNRGASLVVLLWEEDE